MMKSFRKQRLFVPSTIVSLVIVLHLSVTTIQPSLSFQPTTTTTTTVPTIKNSFGFCSTSRAIFVTTSPGSPDDSRQQQQPTSTCLFSSLGGGTPPPPGDNGDGDKEKWDEFLDPTRKESENLQRAREYMSENSLPISFGDSSTDDEEDESSNNGDDDDDDEVDTITNPAAGGIGGGDLVIGDISKESLERNPYVAVVTRLSPSELISKFTATAHPRVQNAVRTTILGLIGGLPKMAFDTTTYTTGQRLASLMFQLQMTGYMFKNAEYRISLQNALLDPYSVNHQQLLLSGSDDDDDEEREMILRGKVRGKMRIKVPSINTGGEGKTAFVDETTNSSAPATTTTTTSSSSSSSTTTTNNSNEIEVDAEAYMSELRSEVSRLRDELSVARKEKEEAIRKDLLLYIRTLPEKELRSLTNTMSQDVLVAMKGLVNAVMSGIGEGQIGPDTITEQSGEAMAQLCMWQLAIGYNLRTLEVREEMKKSLQSSSDQEVSGGNRSDPDGGVDLSSSDAFE